MVIPDQYRKCVIFLFADSPDSGRQPIGTAFIVGVPAEPPQHAATAPALGTNEGWFIHYLVTARHIVSLSRKYGPLFARVHTADGETSFLDFPQEAWHEHATADVAVAVLRMATPLDHTTIPIESFELDATVTAHRVSIGDEVFFMGLFSEHPGAERNEPIARFGNISLMPTLVRVDLGDSTGRQRAYLVEARSWGGHSGSPAFVFFPPDRFLNSISVSAAMPIFLLGLV